MISAWRYVVSTLAALLLCAGAAALAQTRSQWVDPPRDIPVQDRGTGLSAPETPADPPRAVEREAPPVLPPPPVEAPPQRRSAPAARPAPPRSVEEIPVIVSVPDRPQRVSPSFNCRYARTPVERSICSDPVLSAKDRRMAVLYEQAGGSRYGPVDPGQWRWLAYRNSCGRARGAALEACVEQAYDARIAELSGRRR